MTGCLVAFGVMEREPQARELSIYKLKCQLSCRGQAFILSATEQLKIIVLPAKERSLPICKIKI
jgi:hypothetical protein